MIVQKAKIFLAIMKIIGQYMPAPSNSKKFKQFVGKYDAVIQVFRILYHRAYFVGVAVIYGCDLHALFGKRITLNMRFFT